jgi:hypothetical protein
MVQSQKDVRVETGLLTEVGYRLTHKWPASQGAMVTLVLCSDDY